MSGAPEPPSARDLLQAVALMWAHGMQFQCPHVYALQGVPLGPQNALAEIGIRQDTGVSVWPVRVAVEGERCCQERYQRKWQLVTILRS